MRKTGVKVAVCALAGSLIVFGSHSSLMAKTNFNKVLPAAGIGVMLDDGMTIEELAQEVSDNLAYFTAVSGAQTVTLLSETTVPLAEDTEKTGFTPQLVASAEAILVTDPAKETLFSVAEQEESVEEITEEMTEEELVEEEPATEEVTEEIIEEEPVEEDEFGNLVIAQVRNYVNVRSLPSEDGEIVGKLYDKSVGELVEEVDGWYQITSGKCTGYVKAEYCVTGKEANVLAKEVGTTYAVVNTTTLKVRQEPGLDATVLGLVPNEEELVVVEELDGWVKVSIEEGDGYVSRDYVNLKTEFVHAESKEEEQARLDAEKKEREEALRAAREMEQQKAAQRREQEATQAAETAQEAVQTPAPEPVVYQEGDSAIGQSVINYAKQFVGNPYVYGGTSLTNGTDCSGFVMKVYENFGVSLPHSSSALRGRGSDVGGLANAQPGDIVCYSGHVGLYAGGGKIVHASNSRTGIIISDANYRTILSVRRIF